MSITKAFRFTEEDSKKLDFIQTSFGISSEAETIRIALKFALDATEQIKNLKYNKV